MRWEVIFTGSGGQGLGLAGLVLAEAAGVEEDRYVVQTQSYGIQSRGGASRSSVIISDSPIGHPEVRDADIVVCLSQQGHDAAASFLNPGGTLVVDRDLVNVPPRDNLTVLALPFTYEADALGRRVTANIIALGMIAGRFGLVAPESIATVIGRRLAGNDIALKALKVGVSMGNALE